MTFTGSETGSEGADGGTRIEASVSGGVNTHVDRPGSGKGTDTVGTGTWCRYGPTGWPVNAPTSFTTA